MLSVFKTLHSWEKQHPFHLVTSVVLLIGTVIAMYHQIFLFSLMRDVNGLEKKLEDTHLAIKVVSDSTNARVDNISSMIQYDEKRKILLNKVKEAITKNSQPTKLGLRELNKIANAVMDYSLEYNLTIPQVLAQIKAESGFNPKAKSHAGAQGLMQVMPSTFKFISYDLPDAPKNMDVWNIDHNIRAGCYYMYLQMTRFGSYKDAVISFNWGPENLAKYKAGEIAQDEMPRETVNYLASVYKYIEVFKAYGLEQ